MKLNDIQRYASDFQAFGERVVAVIGDAISVIFRTQAKKLVNVRHGSVRFQLVRHLTKK